MIEILVAILDYLKIDLKDCTRVDENCIKKLIANKIKGDHEEKELEEIGEKLEKAKKFTKEELQLCIDKIKTEIKRITTSGETNLQIMNFNRANKEKESQQQVTKSPSIK